VIEYLVTEDTIKQFTNTFSGYIQQGFARWETLPRKPRNIVAGAACLVGCLAMPKLFFIATASSVFAGRHLYLSEENEVQEDPKPDSDPDSEFGHP